MSITLVGPAATVSVDVQRGAKITSLRGPDAFEWLTTTPARRVTEPARYGFTDAEMCGWDECAPTIAAAHWSDGRALADHGDVWDVPWTVVDQSDTTLTTSVTLDRLDFTLTRVVRVTETGVALDYSATTEQPGEWPFLWAAHPQFAAPEGMRLEVPGLDVAQLVHPQVVPAVAWQAPDLPPSTSSKHWAIDPALPPGASLVRTLADGTESRLDLRWSGEALRGLALWFDAGDFAAEPCVAIEPSTGRGDAADDLIPGAEVALLSADRALVWSLELQFLPSPALV